MAVSIIEKGHAQTLVTPKGKSSWAQVLKANQYGKFEVTLLLTEEDAQAFEAQLQPILDAGIKDVEKAGKQYNVAELNKGKDENGLVMYKFKQDEFKRDGSKNSITIVNKQGNAEPNWDKLIGNGSGIKVKAWINPYYMATTKTVGLSMKLNAVQVIDLVEYSSNGSFGNEEAPFDTDNKDF